MFRNSFRLMLGNFSIVLKLTLYRIIVAIVIIAIGAAIVLPNILSMIETFMTLGGGDVLASMGSFIKEFSIESPSFTLHLKELYDIVVKVIVMFANNLVFTYVSIFFLTLFYNFFVYSSDVPMAELLNETMSSNTKINFTTAFITKLGINIKYTLIKLCVAFPIDLIIFFSGIFILINGTGFFAIIAPQIAMFVVIALSSFKLTLLSLWLPTMIVERISVTAAFKKSIKAVFRNFFKIFATMIAMVILSISVFVLVTISTLGVATVVLTPCVVLLFKCYGFALYYHNDARSYYIDYDVIITPKKLLEKESNFNYDLKY